MAEHDVAIHNVSFAYNSVPILEDVNFVVDRSEFVTIVGPNGGGKTTLLKLLLGLLHPDAGDVRIFGDKPEKSRFRIGYMPQHVFLDLKFPVTVLDVVLLGRLGKRIGGRYTKRTGTWPSVRWMKCSFPIYPIRSSVRYRAGSVNGR